MDKANLLYRVIGKFTEIDLHPDVVSNLSMGYLYEELIRRFSELSNETGGCYRSNLPHRRVRSLFTFCHERFPCHQ